MRFIVRNGFLTPDHSKEAVPITQIETIPLPLLNEHFQYNPALQNHLSGKQLLRDEIPFTNEEIQQHYENGYILIRKGIIFVKNKPKCERCGNENRYLFAAFPCARCETECTYCRKCIMMGRVSACTPLYSWKGPIPDLARLAAPFLTWDGNLSDGQQTASNRVIQAIESNKELLVWAVAGAGKTEVLFAGIDHALSAGKRVCIATPRFDVVRELAPRLQAVFPTIDVAALHGGSPDRHKFSPLTISTTHQLLRFYQAFDVIILDEVDAFPYSVDEMLQYAVARARKPMSSIIYLTATPNSKWQKECRQGKRDFVTIPARYHRHPLPVPRFVWCGNWQKQLAKNKLPKNVNDWVKTRLEADKQALLFIPKIALAEKIVSLLRKFHPDIESVHSEDPERKEKVERMRRKEIPLLVTTTILERGVTFPNLDVAVFGAEETIFTESALVQIAGRVGRSADYPHGDVVFFHFGKTEAMIKAKKQIEKMNEEGRLRGLIDG